MKIGLMGCEFVSPNKGCEALTYSIISVLNDISKIEDNSIIYNFCGTELGYIPKEFPRFKFINIKPKIKDFKLRYLKALKSCDIILDATMGDSFSDIYSKKYFKYLMMHKRLAEKICNKYILLPQTYGPFNDSESKKIAEKVLKKANMIFCRDSLSQEILKKDFNIKDTVLTSDMAFILPYDKNKYKMLETNRIRVGINISGLLYKGGFESENQFDLKIDYKDYIDKIINYFQKENKYEIHIIPHVIDLSENAHDDDYKICKEIAQKYKDCILAPAFNTPIEAKSYIANMDIFIGSRMHATIAAFSSGVVTIPVSYSRKFEGLFNSIDYSYVINGKECNCKEAINKTIKSVESMELLKTNQLNSISEINKKNKIFKDKIRTIFEK